MANFQDIVLGQYVPGNSFVHRTDPRVKLLLAMIFSVTLFALSTWVGYVMFALYIGLAASVARIPLAFLARGVRPLATLIVLAAAMHVFLTPGTHVIWQAGPVRVTGEGVVTAGQMTARLILLLSGVSLMTLTTSPLALTDGLERLLHPFRYVGVPSHEIAMMMTIALRFIPTFAEELNKITMAQMARGADLEGGGLVRRGRNLVTLFVPLFASVFRRADELGVAMEARGYRGGVGRTRMKALTFRLSDWLVLSITGLLCLTAARFL